MKWHLVILLSIFIGGCDQKSTWIHENSRMTSETLSNWLSTLDVSNCDYSNQSFEFGAFSNRLGAVLNSANDADNYMKPLHFPVCLKVSRTRMTDIDMRLFNRRIRDRLVRTCCDKYEFELLMFDSCKGWENDRVYFVEDVEDDVNVVVVEIGKINEWNYSGGSIPMFCPNKCCLDECGDGVGMYKIWLSNIIDDVFRECQSGSFADFLRNVTTGSALIYWDSGPRPALCGRHVFSRKEFMDWIKERYYAYRLKLIRATENEYVFVWEYCSSDTGCRAPNWMGASLKEE